VLTWAACMCLPKSAKAVPLLTIWAYSIGQGISPAAAGSTYRTVLCEHAMFSCVYVCVMMLRAVHSVFFD
jgi:hypothetical protein